MHKQPCVSGLQWVVGSSPTPQPRTPSVRFTSCLLFTKKVPCTTRFAVWRLGFGGGQIGLGLAAFGLCFVVLTGLKKFELSRKREQKGTLRVVVSTDGPGQDELASLLKRAAFSLENPSLFNEKAPVRSRSFGWKLQWKGKPDEANLPPAIQELATRPDILLLELTR